MKEMSTEEFKQISFELLVQFDRFCKENDIKYSLSYGTLLGAVRHKGFIPWDDDVDVMLERTEYNKLLKLFPIIYCDHFGIDSIDTNPLWNRPYAKFYDNRTLIFENAPYNPLGQGVGIDVFPIDFIPDNPLFKVVKTGLVKIYGWLFLFKSVRRGAYRKKIHNVCLDVVKVFLLPFPKRQLAVICHKIATCFNKKGGSKMAYCCEGKYINSAFDSNVFDKYVEIPFEGKVFQSISNAYAFLNANYGDYMQLPPEEKRVTHHAYKAYWK